MQLLLLPDYKNFIHEDDKAIKVKNVFLSIHVLVKIDKNNVSLILWKESVMEGR